MTSTEEQIKRALAEDIGDGDHSSLACFPDHHTGRARLIAKQQGILCGIDVATLVFKTVDSDLTITPFKKDGDPISSGEIICEVSGKTISILAAERLSLNYLQRLSGIATYTHFLVGKLAGLHTKILDTRKTTPNMRLLEKMAVRAGGGVNHRFGLYDMIMLKDNHIDFAGGIAKAIDATQDYLSTRNKQLLIVVEARNLKEVKEVLSCAGVHRILLDNFEPEELKIAVELINGKIQTEASGGITEENIRAYAETGVDYISVGALTHHISSLDISLKAF